VNLKKKLSEISESHRNALDLFFTASGFVITAVVSLSIVKAGVKIYSRALDAWPAALVWSIASFTCGFAVGFLFGIPRVLQENGSAPAESSKRGSDYKMRVNTNLEQISDWLTKIIVGVGLVQLTSTPGFLKKVGSFASRSFNFEESLAGPAASFGVGIISLFFAQGFLAGYTLTRLFLAGAFGRADKEAIGTGVVVAPQNLANGEYTPSAGANKILATLWHHQDKVNRERRFTFTILPNSPDYADFKKGLDELFQKGLVSLTPEGQVMLTDSGIAFVEGRNEEFLGASDVFKF
jgi:hypothetical protein